MWDNGSLGWQLARLWYSSCGISFTKDTILCQRMAEIQVAQAASQLAILAVLNKHVALAAVKGCTVT